MSRAYDLLEMAFGYPKLEDKVTALAEPIALHIMKVLTFKDDVNKHKHLDDIDNWLLDIESYPSKAKRQSLVTRYHKWIFTDWVPDQPSAIKRATRKLKQYQNLPNIRSYADSYAIMMKASSRVASDVALKKYSTISDYIKELK